MGTSKSVCGLHIDDYAIRSYIRKNAKPGYCYYCERDKKVVDLDDLRDFMMEGLENHYDDAANFLPYESAEGGYQGSTRTAHELLSDLVEIDDDRLLSDLAWELEDYAWSDPDDYYGSESDHMMYEWEDFKKIIKHKSRYLFTQQESDKPKHLRDAYQIMDDVGKAIKQFRLIKTLPEKTVVFRARQHKYKDPIKRVEQLCSPPDKDAFFSNRFSPAGISMFYCAFDQTTAYVETFNPENKRNKRLTTGTFETNQILKVIDFTSIPKIPSVFDLKRFKQYSWILFLKAFIADLSAGVAKDGREHVDYVPTQVMTEYLRFPFCKSMRHKIDGIMYPSSKPSGKKACVLFWNHEESITKVKLLKKQTHSLKFP